MESGYDDDVCEKLAWTWNGRLRLKIARAEWLERRRAALEAVAHRMRANTLAGTILGHPRSPMFSAPYMPVFTAVNNPAMGGVMGLNQAAVRSGWSAAHDVARRSCMDSEWSGWSAAQSVLQTRANYTAAFSSSPYKLG
jgi:hypothetical protein